MIATPPATINSILARCLMDPAFLSDVLNDPTARFSSVEVDERTRSQLAALDWTRVRAFAGFITKVQHNDLWPVLPYTRAALKAYRFEIELFARYRPSYLLLRSGRPTREEKVANFLGFLDGAVAPGTLPGLRDIAHHEEARWLADAAAAAAAAREDTDSGPGVLLDGHDPRNAIKLRPYVRGYLRIAEFETDPEALIGAINRGEFPWPADSSSPRWLGYWVDPIANRVRLLELDALSSRILAQVNGTRSLGTIRRRLRAPWLLIRAVLEAAQAQGLIGIEGRRQLGGRYAAPAR